MRKSEYKITLTEAGTMIKKVFYTHSISEAIKQSSTKKVHIYQWMSIGMVKVIYTDGTFSIYYWDMVKNNLWQRLKDKFLCNKN